MPLIDSYFLPSRILYHDSIFVWQANTKKRIRESFVEGEDLEIFVQEDEKIKDSESDWFQARMSRWLQNKAVIMVYWKIDGKTWDQRESRVKSPGGDDDYEGIEKIVRKATASRRKRGRR